MLKTMVTGETKKHLDVDRIARIKDAVQIPLTLHGGSGTDDDDLRKAVAAGITIVHINTELRLPGDMAWRTPLTSSRRKSFLTNCWRFLWSP